MERIPSVRALLAEVHWLRGLAASLARGSADRDDLVQETWVAALRAPPDPHRPARPWLDRVMRNVWRMTGRGAERRRVREARQAREGDADGPAAAARADELIERAELQRLLADLVLGLDEPYRTAVLLHYYEARPAKQIASDLGIPAGTVRWRITEGVARLRRALAARAGGETGARRWLLALAPPFLSPPRLPRSARTRLAPTLVAASVVMVTGLGLAMWPLVPGPGTSSGPSAARTALPAVTRLTPTTTEEDQMILNRTKTAALLGVALPALMASAQAGGQTLTRDEEIAFCVERWEKIASCAETFAEHFATKVPADRRAAYRLKFVAQAREAGTGPIEPRRERCAESVDRIEPSQTRAQVEEVRVCLARPDCPSMVACMKPILDRAPTKKPR